MPLIKQWFSLNKSEFRDFLCLRYGKDLKGLPSKCSCGNKYNVTHALLNCHKGGFIIIQHNEVRDFEANLLKMVYNEVECKPTLQPLSNEITTSLQCDNARPDIHARGFWRPGQHAFFDVKIINPNSATYSNITQEKAYKPAEHEKKRNYNDRILNVEHDTFTPLIYSINDGMGTEAQ